MIKDGIRIGFGTEFDWCITKNCSLYKVFKHTVSYRHNLQQVNIRFLTYRIIQTQHQVFKHTVSYRHKIQQMNNKHQVLTHTATHRQKRFVPLLELTWSWRVLVTFCSSMFRFSSLPCSLSLGFKFLLVSLMRFLAAKSSELTNATVFPCSTRELSLWCFLIHLESFVCLLIYLAEQTRLFLKGRALEM